MTWSPEVLSENIVSIIVAIVSIVLVALLKPLIAKLCAMIESKIKNSNDQTSAQLANNAMVFLNNLVTTTVEYLEQEYGGSIRKGIADGLNTRDDLCKLKDIAIEIVTTQLPEEMKNHILTQVSDLGVYIDNLVSEKVRETKKSDANK